MSQTPNLALPYIAAGQAQKEVTHAEALNRLDAAVGLSVLDRDLTTPPGSPSLGSRYIVAIGATGAWNGQAGRIAAWYGSWIFLQPQEGWEAWIQDEDVRVRWTGAAWAIVGGTARSGWSAPTGAQARGSFNADTADLANTRQTLAALIADLRALGLLT